MNTLLKHRRTRFAALHAILTGAGRAGGDRIPPALRRDVGLPETLETRPQIHGDPVLGLARLRD